MSIFWTSLLIFFVWIIIGLLVVMQSSKYWRKDIDPEASLVVYAFGTVLWPVIIWLNRDNYYNDIKKLIKKLI